MTNVRFVKSKKYDDYDTIYAQCSGPGGLQLAEFLAEKMKLQSGKKLLDVGCNRGYQSCFLAKEYDVFTVGIDPWDDREQGNPMVEHFLQNAEHWGVTDKVLGLYLGVPDTPFAQASFDYAYSTTALEMVRVSQGTDKYLECIRDIYRVLKPGGMFGLGEPMHLDVEVPPDLDPYISRGEYPWKSCFRDLKSTIDEVKAAGFEIVEADYAPDAWQWWMDFAKHDPFCKADPDDDPLTLQIDNGRWTSFGYIIARKPEND